MYRGADLSRRSAAQADALRYVPPPQPTSPANNVNPFIQLTFQLPPLTECRVGRILSKLLRRVVRQDRISWGSLQFIKIQKTNLPWL